MKFEKIDGFKKMTEEAMMKINGGGVNNMQTKDTSTVRPIYTNNPCNFPTYVSTGLCSGCDNNTDTVMDPMTKDN